nr:fasciclin domain-containing protein [Acaricomes phytoseiuli]
MLRMKTAVPATLAAGVLALTLSACGSGSFDSNSNNSSPMSNPMMSSSAPTTSAMADGPVGPGCKAYAEANATGPGSISGMAEANLTQAASGNPLLTTLVKAVSGQLNPDVNLVDTLNGDQFTVFAPTDEAFAKLDPATVETLKTDSALLTKILTYHVVPGKVSPDKITGSSQTTVEGQKVMVSGSPSNLKVNDNSAVICGGVKTANATVYLVDTVLMPPAN